MKTKIYLIIVLLMAPMALFAEKSKYEVVDPPIKKFKVVLDAGHGGDDGGTSYAGVKEKDVALSVTLALGKKLEQHANIEVIYTRKKDVFVKLRDRADIANKANADLFVSIHCNAVANESASGNETWVLGLRRSNENLDVVMKENSVILLEDDYKENYDGFDPNDPSSYATSLLTQESYMEDSIDLAAMIQDNFSKQVQRKNRGVKQNVFAVLRLSYMPSILVEMGFISNPSERKFLTSAAGKEKVTSSIYEGILSYIKTRDINTSEIDVSDTSKNSTATAASSINSNVIYKVQIAAGSKSIPAKSYNFNKLPSISREKEGNVYRYFTGETSSLKEASDLKALAVKKGYKTAFIVIIENGERRRF